MHAGYGPIKDGVWKSLYWIV